SRTVRSGIRRSRSTTARPGLRTGTTRSHDCRTEPPPGAPRDGRSANQSTVVAGMEGRPPQRVAGPVVADPERGQPGPSARLGWRRTDSGRDEAEHLDPAHRLVVRDDERSTG